MSGAAVQDGVPGDLQCQLGLEVLIGQTVGALRPPIAEQSLSEEVRQRQELLGWRLNPVVFKNFMLMKIGKRPWM